MMLAILFTPALVGATPSWYLYGHPGVEGYVTPDSVKPGDTVDFHVSSTIGDFRIQIYKVGAPLELMYTSPVIHGEEFLVPSEKPWEGASWPSVFQFQIPENWPSRPYVGKLVPTGQTIWDWYVFFLVRPAVPGSTSRILSLVETSTMQAYNKWGGKSTYVSLVPGEGKAVRVSFERPYGDGPRAAKWDHGISSFYMGAAWTFAELMDEVEIPIEFATSIDLEDPNLVDAYDLIVSTGHDEYYSKEMFDALENHRNRGGGLAFFGGNNVYRGARFENGGSSLVTYKELCSQDPYWQIDPSRVTCDWKSAAMGRPNAALTGVDYVYYSYQGIYAPYTVVDASHWVFEGTGLSNGDSIGPDMVGGETETRVSASPPNIRVLLYAELTDKFNPSTTYAAEATYYETTPEYGFPAGPIGRVFSGSSILYSRGIDNDSRVGRITENVVRHLSDRAPDGDVDGIPDREDVCRDTWNPDQSDQGGVEPGTPGGIGDGIGDACQCGDVTDDGKVMWSDVEALRNHLASPDSELAAPVKCQTSSIGSCSIVDVVRIQRSLVSLAGGIQHLCE